MDINILILAAIAVLELFLIAILNKQLKEFRINYSQSILKICDMFIDVGSRIEELDRRLKKMEVSE